MKRLIIAAIVAFSLLACNQKKQPGYVVQVSLGGWDKANYTVEQVCGRIDSVASLINVEKVIIGWTLDKDFYKQLGAHLHSKNIQMLFWLPVFAETEGVCDNVPAVDLWGNIPANFDLADEEGFRFNCPGNPQNAANLLALYDHELADCGFDGVFMDRIRTQSFVSGVSGILNCGCPDCVLKFWNEGVDLEAVKAAWETQGDHFFDLLSYDPAAGPEFAEPLAAAFFEAKGHVVSNAVAAIADSLRSRGLIIGMDLYAPFMAPFVGQDYAILSSHADFIKPMLYRKTLAPAGMGFEYDLMRAAIPDAGGYPEFPMDVDFLRSQLRAMGSCACGRYPGIEINYREGIVETSPEYVTECLDEIMGCGYDGAVLSWNIMEAPQAHIACLSRQ